MVLTKNNKAIVTVEIKYGSLTSSTKGHTNAVQDIGSTKNFIIVPESLPFVLHNGLEVMSLTDFIKDIHSTLK